MMTRMVRPARESSPIVVGLSAVIVAVTDGEPRVLTVQRAEHSLATPEALRSEPSPAGEHWSALPFGPLDPEGDRTLELGLRGWVRQQTGLDLGYVEQLYTFGDRYRDTRARPGTPRLLSVAYLALVREGQVAGAGQARWRDCYEFLPWEDRRASRPGLISKQIAPPLSAWAESGKDGPARAQRRERVDIAFGLRGASWDADRVLERYELLYEAGLLMPEPLGKSMVLDHRRILATALGRLRGKIRYRPVVFELLPATFTLLQLQRTVESLAGLRLHKQNFRRLVEKGGLVEGTAEIESRTGGRPAERFRFRREVLRERRAPGVGLPGARAQGPKARRDRPSS
jgi:hypothetical protein